MSTKTLEKTTTHPTLTNSMLSDNRPANQLRLAGPPPHTKSIHVNVRLEWSHNGQKQSEEALLLLDSGATGAVLSSTWVTNAQLPCIRQGNPTPISDASGNHIPGSDTYYTKTVDMSMGNHTNKMRFELADMPSGHLDGYLPIAWLKDHNLDINWEKGCLKWRSDYSKAHCLKGKSRIEFITGEELLAEDPKNIFVCGMRLWTGEDGEDISLKLLPQYRDYADIFSEEKINVLPEHTEYDHCIDLIPGSDLPKNHIYPLTVKELQVLKEYINEMEKSGKIQKSSSTIGAPILFVLKPDGTLRLCVNYRELNKITIKKKYPLPLMNELRSRLGKATVFTKLDLKNGYYLMHIAEGEEWKTAFKSQYGLYEYTVMPFGLCNAPSTFRGMINDVFHDMLDVGVIAYHINLNKSNTRWYVKLECGRGCVMLIL